MIGPLTMPRHLVLVLALAACAVPPPGAPQVPAAASRLDAIELVIQDAIAAKRLPGAVVLVGRGGDTLYHRAFGLRSVVPGPEPMTPDTIFDVASLTKVVATATSVMILVEDGRLGLNDRVAAHLSGFERNGKGGITIRHLLTHMSGLRPGLDVAAPWTGADTAVALAIGESPASEPGSRFVYSDINFILLGEIVRRVSGEPLDRFSHRRIFAPLGMADTSFVPPAGARGRIAPTAVCPALVWPCPAAEMKPLRGVVHDPTSARMGGVAGHAGLFSTAADLAIFSRMLLSHGSYRGVRVLSPASVARMTAPATPDFERNRRALGWDIDSTFSSVRGDLFPIGSFGHTGYTGTSLWLDPASGVFVVFLSNRVHPDGTGDVSSLRGRVSTIAASLIADPPRRMAPAVVRSGLDVLRAERFAALKGKRIGLVTNQTGRARDGASAIDLLHESAGTNGHTLVALFSPEHGIRGVLDAAVPSATDEKTGLPIFSLYSDTRRPTGAMLEGLDTLVVDLQDIGSRFYTYMTTLAYVMEEAAARKLAVIVLDRPNPIGGVQVEGPTLDEAAVGFTGYFPAMPIRHGMTLGELARLFNAERAIGANLSVVPLGGWRRELWFDQTGLPWTNPSPNMRNLHQATLYPGIGAIEGTNISVGRGTDSPFEQIGAPWIDAVELSSALTGRGIPGVAFYPVRFTPSSSRYAGEECQGVFMIVTDRHALRPVRLGLEIAAALHGLYGARFDLDAAHRLFGSRDTLTRIRAGENPEAIVASWADGEAGWRRLRAKYLLY